MEFNPDYTDLEALMIAQIALWDAVGATHLKLIVNVRGDTPNLQCPTMHSSSWNHEREPHYGYGRTLSTAHWSLLKHIIHLTRKPHILDSIKRLRTKAHTKATVKRRIIIQR